MAEARFLLIKRVDADLHRCAKVAAAHEGMTLREWVMQAMAEKLAGPRPAEQEVAAPVHPQALVEP